MNLFAERRQCEIACVLPTFFYVEFFAHWAGEPIEFIKFGRVQSLGCHALNVVCRGGNDGAELSTARRQLDHALAAMIGSRRALNYSIAFHSAQSYRHRRLLDADQPR